MSHDKEQATRLADALDNSPLTAGLPHSEQAAALLRRWPDGEPVAWIQSDHLAKAQRAPHLCRVEPTEREGGFTPLYTAPPAERIAALEAALEQARVALDEMQYARTDKAERLTTEALRAIEEVRK